MLMKKLLFILLSLSISMPAYSESPQLRYIKEMYEWSVSSEKSSSNNFDYDYYRQYFDKNIRKLYIWGMIIIRKSCIDYDVLWQEQDLDPFAKLTFIQSDKDRVKVIIDATKGFEERFVIYQIRCQKDNDYKITEIFE